LEEDKRINISDSKYVLLEKKYCWRRSIVVSDRGVEPLSIISEERRFKNNPQ